MIFVMFSLVFPVPEIFLVWESVPKIVIVIRHEELITARVNYHLGHCEAVKICCRGYKYNESELSLYIGKASGFAVDVYC